MKSLNCLWKYRNIVKAAKYATQIYIEKLAAAETMGEKKINIFVPGMPVQYNITMRIGNKIWAAPKSGSRKTNIAGMVTIKRGASISEKFLTFFRAAKKPAKKRIVANFANSDGCIDIDPVLNHRLGYASCVNRSIKRSSTIPI